MRTLLTRRQILASGIAMVGAVSLPPMAQTAAAPESPAAKLRLTADTRTLDVNGKPARVFGLTGPNGKPGITLSPGERFRVDLVNRAGTSFTRRRSCSLDSPHPTAVRARCRRAAWATT